MRCNGVVDDIRYIIFSNKNDVEKIILSFDYIDYGDNCFVMVSKSDLAKQSNIGVAFLKVLKSVHGDLSKNNVNSKDKKVHVALNLNDNFEYNVNDSLVKLGSDIFVINGGQSLENTNSKRKVRVRVNDNSGSISLNILIIILVLLILGLLVWFFCKYFLFL